MQLWLEGSSGCEVSYMRKIVKNDEAFTGLEAAIVLIAFVVVAAVFSYVVLGAGFFTTQKSQEVVHSGVSAAASNLVVKGDVYGIADNATNPTGIAVIQYDVGLAAGGMPIDMNKTVMVYSDTTTNPTPMEMGSGWNITGHYPSSQTDNVLQYGETFTVQLYPPSTIPPRTAFAVEVRPEIGAALSISRSVPPSITNTTIIY